MNRDIGLVEPVLGWASGGTLYNDAVARHWPPTAPPLVRHRIYLGDSDSRAGEALDVALSGHGVSIVDGLLGCEYPHVLKTHRAVLLVHLPRPADSGLSDERRRALAKLERESVWAASAVVVPSEWAARDLERRYAFGDAVVARPGVERAPLAEPHDPPVVLQLGTVSALKNQLLTARAAQGLDVRLRIVGPITDSAYAAEVRALVPIEPAVVPTEVGGVLAEADLLVSVSSQEMWGMVVTEALAHGIPAVVGRGTGAEEALSAGATDALPGCAVDTADPAELRTVLTAFLRDPGLRARWREAARAARHRLASWEDTAAVIARTARAAQSAPASAPACPASRLE